MIYFLDIEAVRDLARDKKFSPKKKAVSL